MSKIIKHQIRVKQPTGVRALIEIRLGVKTTAESLGYGIWVIHFETPEDVNLDFLHPDVLPFKVDEPIRWNG